MTNKIIFSLFFMTSLVTLACMTQKSQKMKSMKPAVFFKNKNRKPSSLIVNFAETNQKKSLEAKLGNLLIEAQNNKNKIIISFPAQIYKSQYHPFGDGQSNAKMSFGESWKESEFPVLGIQSLTAIGAIQRIYKFHDSLKITDYVETKLDNNIYKVQPKGWVDSFYFSFETSSLTATQFLKDIPEKYRTFSQNRIAPDPEKISLSKQENKFLNIKMGEGYNQDPWFSDNVHAKYPDQNGMETALGGVLTWGLTDKKFGPFKHLYTCFQGRNQSSENMKGLPTGAGWHHVGDSAEGILNSIDKKPMPAGIAKTHGQAHAAYGLTEVVTAFWLEENEVFVTKNNEFHWYLNPYEEALCTEIWVHECIPSLDNNWGFNCQK